MRAAPESFAIWADMGYMVPPFLARGSQVFNRGGLLTIDLGMATNSSDLLRSALEQYELESNYILDEEAHLHRHVSQDWGKGFWATGNGWMTYGLMRVVSLSSRGMH
jgi:rhamnogalacturonyl hydrolase YesR